MATKQSTVDSILAQTAEAAGATARKMFGEYGIFVDEKMVAIVGEDQLFVKMTAGGADMVGDCNEVPPYPGAKPCFLIPEEKWGQPGWLAELFTVSASELPKPKKKKSPTKS